jgi:uroporphyrinogen-III synthase
MIPLVIPPLSNLRVVVTRPVQQAEGLCTAITQRGGDVIRLPVLEIKAREVQLSRTSYDLVVVISANAVLHGAALLKQLLTARTSMQIAVIGNATAAALQSIGVEAHIAAAAPFNSEALLTHEKLQSPPSNVLIVRGVGGRDVLRETLTMRGAQVDVIEVYERAVALIADDQRAALGLALKEGMADAITFTSADIAQALMSLLTDEEREWTKACTAVAGSARIAEQLPGLGWQGDCIVSNSPDDITMLDTMVRWHARSRN